MLIADAVELHPYFRLGCVKLKWTAVFIQTEYSNVSSVNCFIVSIQYRIFLFEFDSLIIDRKIETVVFNYVGCGDKQVADNYSTTIVQIIKCWKNIFFHDSGIIMLNK